MSTFQGFPREAFTFLADIKENNDKAWFAPRKEEYVSEIVEPGQALVAELGPRLQKIVPGVQYDTSASGRGSVKRIYRDVRFAKDKRPYKDYFGLVFWEGEGSKKEIPGFGFRMNATGGRMYAGLYRFASPVVRDAYRLAVDRERSGAELQTITDSLVKSGAFELGGSHYKRVPRGFDPEHPRAELLKYNGIWALSPELSLKQLQSPKLVDICEDFARQMAPVHTWLIDHLY